jgi:predicted small secreted protein
MNLLNKYKIYILIAIVIGSGLTYYFMFHNMSREKAIKIIKDSGKHSMADDTIFGTEYLKAWAKAVVKENPSFIFEGKTYNTKGGTALK